MERTVRTIEGILIRANPGILEINPHAEVTRDTANARSVSYDAAKSVRVNLPTDAHHWTLLRALDRIAFVEGETTEEERTPDSYSIRTYKTLEVRNLETGDMAQDRRLKFTNTGKVLYRSIVEGKMEGFHLYGAIAKINAELKLRELKAARHTSITIYDAERLLDIKDVIGNNVRVTQELWNHGFSNFQERELLQRITDLETGRRYEVGVHPSGMTARKFARWKQYAAKIAEQ